MDTPAPPPLLVILGPTASGKSSLGLEAAERLGGEIVSADAFAVYRGLDIGTDKPTASARARVRHHLIDIAEPTETFSAGEFADAAQAAIREISGRNRCAVVVGGTHFYIRALLFGLFPSPPRDPEIGSRLAESWEADPAAVFDRLCRVDPDAGERISPRDRQRVLRALEIYELTGEAQTDHWKRHRQTPRFAPLLIAPRRSREELYVRIEARVDSMFASGLVEEVESILASGVPVSAHSMKAIGYREVVEMTEGSIDLGTAIDNSKRSSRRFAKRQLTWLRDAREGTVHWVPPAEDGGAAAVIHLWDKHTKERRAT